MKTVSVRIDYSNGSEKSFTAVPWANGLTIVAALEAAGTIPPGLTVEYGSSRNGSVINLSLDGVPENRASGEWSIWVNQRPAPGRLGTETSFRFEPESRAANEVEAGDHILAKLVAPPADES